MQTSRCSKLTGSSSESLKSDLFCLSLRSFGLASASIVILPVCPALIECFLLWLGQLVFACSFVPQVECSVHRVRLLLHKGLRLGLVRLELLHFDPEVLREGKFTIVRCKSLLFWPFLLLSGYSGALALGRFLLFWVLLLPFFRAAGATLALLLFLDHSLRTCISRCGVDVLVHT